MRRITKREANSLRKDKEAPKPKVVQAAAPVPAFSEPAPKPAAPAPQETVGMASMEASMQAMSTNAEAMIHALANNTVMIEAFRSDLKSALEQRGGDQPDSTSKFDFEIIRDEDVEGDYKPIKRVRVTKGDSNVSN